MRNRLDPTAFPQSLVPLPILFDPLYDFVAGKTRRGRYGTDLLIYRGEGVLTVGQLGQCFIHNMRINDAFATPAFQYLKN